MTQVNVEYRPTCAQCNLRLTDASPEAEVKALLRDLTEALKQKTRQLAGEAVSRVLAKDGRDDMQKLIEAVQASNLAALVDVMSPDMVDFINRLLAEEKIFTIKAEGWRQLTQQYTSLEEKDIEAVVDAFRQLLEQAFAEAKEANPDKKTIRLTLR